MPRHRFSPSARSARRAKGFTLLELILVLGVSAMITLLTFQTMRRDNEQVQARAAGDQLRIVGTALNNYISARYTQITAMTTVAANPSNTTDPGPRTCSGSVCTITVATLVNEGMLPSNYQNNNAFGSGYNIQILVSGTSPNQKVNGMVLTATPWKTGTSVRYDLLGSAMREAGPDSAMSRTTAAQMDGYGGIWTEASTSYSAINQLGLLGFRAGYGSSLYSVYLRRDGTLPMTGDLNMSDGTNHSIDNVGSITGTGTLTMSSVYTSYEKVTGNLDVTGAQTVGGALAVGTNESVANNLTVGGAATVTGTVTANKVVLPSGNSLQIGSSYFYGDGANTASRSSGFYVQSADGSSYSNVYANDVYISSRGHWLSQMAPVYSSRGAYYVANGTGVAKPTCSAGTTPGTAGTAEIVVTPADQAIGSGVNTTTWYASGQFVVRAVDEGTYWLIQDYTLDYAGNAASGGAVIAHVYCSYT